MKKDFKNLKELRENGKLKAKGFAQAPMESLRPGETGQHYQPNIIVLLLIATCADCP